MIDIVRLLLEKGIDVNAKDKNNWNAIHFVINNYEGDNLTDIVRLFIGKEIDVNAKTQDNWNTLLLLV